MINSPGGSRHDVCVYQSLHGRADAPDTGERFELENARSDSFQPAAAQEGIDRSGYTYLTIPDELPRPVNLMGHTPQGAALVVWHEFVAGAWVRISWVVPKAWIQ